MQALSRCRPLLPEPAGPRSAWPGNIQPIEDYPFEERRKTKSSETSVAEFVVCGGVPDIANHLTAAYRAHEGRRGWLFGRPGRMDHPL